jgi:hypothetical protein
MCVLASVAFLLSLISVKGISLDRELEEIKDIEWVWLP